MCEEEDAEETEELDYEDANPYSYYSMAIESSDEEDGYEEVRPPPASGSIFDPVYELVDYAGKTFGPGIAGVFTGGLSGDDSLYGSVYDSAS